jgi:hypothetical protein
MRDRIAWLNHLYVHKSKCKMFHMEHFSILQAGSLPRAMAHWNLPASPPPSYT